MGRSDVILEQPNVKPAEAMPLGNGRLGVAVWSENGCTAQLNRADTLPKRLSPGQLVIPGLEKIVKARDYSGRLDLFNGEFVERGAGMTARFYVASTSDVLVVEIEGANPNTEQNATLQLWTPRQPKITLQDHLGTSHPLSNRLGSPKPPSRPALSGSPTIHQRDSKMKEESVSYQAFGHCWFHA